MLHTCTLARKQKYQVANVGVKSNIATFKTILKDGRKLVLGLERKYKHETNTQTLLSYQVFVHSYSAKGKGLLQLTTKGKNGMDQPFMKKDPLCDPRQEQPFTILGLPLPLQMSVIWLQGQNYSFLLHFLSRKFYIVRQKCSVIFVSATCLRNGQVSNHALLHYVSG